MNKSSALALLYGMAALSVSTSGGNDGSYGHGIPDKPKKVIPKGCKEYKFYGITVIASSEKKAEQKAYKILKQRNP